MSNAKKAPDVSEGSYTISRAGSVVLGAMLLPGCAVLSQIPPEHDHVAQHNTTVSTITQPLPPSLTASKIQAALFSPLTFGQDALYAALPAPVLMSDEGNSDPSLGFDMKKSAETYRAALLPAIYYNQLSAGKTEAEAEKAVYETVSEGTEIKILKHQNIIVVVAYEAGKDKVTVAFNPSKLSTHADKMDNLKIWPHNHELGGKVHKGYFDSLSRKNDSGQTVSEAVRAQVGQYVAQNMKERGHKTDVVVTGISRGGALAEAVAADWMVGGMPGGDNARLAAVTGFMAVGYGNEKFSENFMQEADKRGTQVMNIKILGDYLTNYMTGEYKHVGDAVFFIPRADGVTTKILVNPSNSELKVELKQMGKLASVVWHEPDIEAIMLGVARMPDIENKAVKSETALTYPQQNYLLNAQKLGFLWRQHPLFSETEKGKLSIVKDTKPNTADNKILPETVIGAGVLESGNENAVSYVEKNDLSALGEKPGSFVEKSLADPGKGVLIAGR